jgi:hypothetical protein
MILIVLAILLVGAAPALAQTDPPGRGAVLADVGRAWTNDDEGALGTGAATSAAVGVRITRRLTIQAVFDRIPYHRDEDYLAFDGRVLFGGLEASFQSARQRVRPFVTIGVGMMNDTKRWTDRVQIGPTRYQDVGVTEHAFTRAMLRSSGGLDVRVSDALSIRTSLRFHGLLDTGSDLAAHIILQPTVGVAWRW